MKHFRKFMEELDSDNKPESRVDAAKRRFQNQKEKSVEELQKTREKIKASRMKSSELKLPSLIKKKKEKE